MTNIRIAHNRDNPYVILNKQAFNDPNLGWDALGLWGYLLSKPDNWKISIAHLSSVKTKGKRDAIRRMLNELIKYGYAEHVEIKDDRGRFKNYEYIVYEFPITQSGQKEANIDPTPTFEPLPENPLTDCPSSETPTLLINESKEVKKENTKKEVSPDVETTCIYFFEKLKKNFFGYEIKSKNEWHKHMTNILKTHSVEEVKQLIDWCQEDQFWKAQILSPSSLDKRWYELQAKRQVNAEAELIRKNRLYALALKDKHPEVLKKLSFDDKYAYNREMGKEIAFNMNHEAFKTAIVSMFGGNRNV